MAFLAERLGFEAAYGCEPDVLRKRQLTCGSVPCCDARRRRDRSSYLSIGDMMRPLGTPEA